MSHPGPENKWIFLMKYLPTNIKHSYVTNDHNFLLFYCELLTNKYWILLLCVETLLASKYQFHSFCFYPIVIFVVPQYSRFFFVYWHLGLNLLGGFPNFSANCRIISQSPNKILPSATTKHVNINTKSMYNQSMLSDLKE